MSPRRKRWGLFLLAGASALTVWTAWPTLAAAALLLDLAGYPGFPRPLLPGRVADVTTEDLMVPTRHGAVDARLYAPVPLSDRTVVVIPGVHGAGIDEPRLAGFARRLAASGVNVLSVPLPDLRAFRITARSTDVIEDVAEWTSANRRLAPDERIGLAGVSFGGGLVVVAAGRPSLAGRLDAVVSLGGHGDLGRVLEYLCTGRLPDGRMRAPHDYSLAVVALAAAGRLVPEAQAASLERAILTYLDAAMDESAERRRQAALLEDARQQAAAMGEPARTIMGWVNGRDVEALGRAIRPHLDALAEDAALSPERSPATSAPVFLLQGLDDTVIPPTETPHLARYLTAHGNPNVRWLLTPLVSHVGVDSAVRPVDWWRLVRFWRAVDAALDSPGPR